MMDAPIVLTCGEPASIAPEITAKAWAALHQDQAHCFFLLGDADDFEARIVPLKLDVPVARITDPSQAHGVFSTSLPVLDLPLPKPSRAAWIDTRNSEYVIDIIKRAAHACMIGTASAMVSNPIHKDALYAAGFKFQGHTDFLASIVQEEGYQVQEVMMLVAGTLRSVPITVHIPLKDVPEALTTASIIAQGEVVAQSLQRFFGIAAPRIAVTGLNPHAGENGAMGLEDRNIIEPAIERLRGRGINAFGPLPGDTSFHAEARATYDAILCMYHDQALIPVKMLDFHGGVNVTLGLPFIRTSPDHGTALGLAGRGTARADSLIAALKLAAEMAAKR
ncbi:4-hydroxythreonine-4-phosphate dehydrogenase PdxA [Aestuariivirga litoralis]|uniref:4-hydroxythreonine-4-phosphate dehydrogenase PdxA n=1 Tax=Aestuariivirga litoralis TaxID=2650924 RepID=UPI0018C67E4D|nr:4-hydroxythreonine-4-phosphate dehydrogenase PdxA [Aestuariivirga litoralis]MBG1232029.1 4-hydroxythreonine-4-phosphate dehydrogenase PdxA [Aestuariivirga litoralis]